jgi:hypothetical protein
MYITTYNDLMHEIETRTRHQGEIRERVEAFIERRFGVPQALKVVRQYFDLERDPQPRAFLARQIASVCVEDIAFQLGAAQLGLLPLTATFVRDTYSSQNHDKVHRIKIPWHSWSKKGNMVARYERIVPAGINYDGVALDSIPCGNGVMLPEYHLQLRQQAQSPGLVSDVSNLHLFMLKTARNSPRAFYRDVKGTQELVPWTEGVEYGDRDRPNAEWYYPYYLSWFLDGSLILFETYENPAGGVPQIKRAFENDMNLVYKETGIMPLVVQVPPLTKELLSCNEHVLQRDCFTELRETLPERGTNDTVSFFASIAESVTRFR